MASGEKEEDIFEEFEEATPERIRLARHEVDHKRALTEAAPELNKEQSQGPSKPSSNASQHHDIPVTEEELEFRRQFESKDVIKDFKKQLCCTVCGNSMYNAIVNGGEVTHHILFEILQCRNCKDYYECGEFSMDEDGTDKYCRWCGGGLTLYCCSKCLFGFCRKCINRHFGLKKVKAIEQDDNWICYVCNVKPLWHLRMICYYAKLHAKNVQDKKNDKQKEKKPKKSDHKLEKSKVEAEKEPCLRTEKGETSESESRNCSFSLSFPKDMPPGASGSGSDSTERNITNNNNNDFFKVEEFERITRIECDFRDFRRKRMRPKKHLKIEKEPDKEESEKESEDEDKIKKRKRRSNVIRDSPETEVEQPEVKDEDFPILLRTAKKDLEDMYRISLMTTELCDRAINKRLGKIKCISTYQNFCKEYSKIEKIIDCLQVHFGHVKTVIKSVKEKLEETKGKEAEI